MQEVDIVEPTNLNCLVCGFGLVIGGRSWLGVGLCVHVLVWSVDGWEDDCGL